MKTNKLRTSAVKSVTTWAGCALAGCAGAAVLVVVYASLMAESARHFSSLAV